MTHPRPSRGCICTVGVGLTPGRRVSDCRRGVWVVVGGRAGVERLHARDGQPGRRPGDWARRTWARSRSRARARARRWQWVDCASRHRHRSHPRSRGRHRHQAPAGRYRRREAGELDIRRPEATAGAGMVAVTAATAATAAQQSCHCKGADHLWSLVSQCVCGHLGRAVPIQAQPEPWLHEKHAPHSEHA